MSEPRRRYQHSEWNAMVADLIAEMSGGDDFDWEISADRVFTPYKPKPKGKR